MLIKNKKTSHHRFKNRSGLSMVELIIVTVLFMILVPTSLAIFVGARKITGQSYIQHQAAVTSSESADILRYMRNLDFDWLVNGTFFLIRNPGTGSWLVKSDLADMDIFERRVVVSDAKRHLDTHDLYFDGETGAFYEDPNTKRVDVSVVWAPDYLPLDLLTHTLYVTNWQRVVTY
ncbi:hypothetical protein JW752_05575 [Candidatus Peregrinibacteria bacterium]|nr:hypothetical protein [Candidatus Peregrinibacteria bacterium]